MAIRDSLEQATSDEETATIVAVIPAFNEERFIGSVVATTLQYANRVIVVNDGSTDRTAVIAQLVGAHVVHMPGNSGYGEALQAGLQCAQALEPEAIVMLDADAQHDPAAIPALVRPILMGDADIVVGSRFLERGSDIPLWRRVGQHALTFMTNRAGGGGTTDSQSGFRAFSPGALEQLRLGSSGMAFASEMLIRSGETSLRVHEVPVVVQYRDGSKRNPLMHGIEVVDGILAVVARRRPLGFIAAPGVLAALAGLLLGLIVVHTADARHAIPVGTAVLSSLLITVGILFGVTGVILNTLESFMGRLQAEIARAGREAKVRPHLEDLDN